MGKPDRVKRLLNALLQAARDGEPRVDWIMSAALGLAAVPLYLIARCAFYNFDALSAAEAVEVAPFLELFHPHHLLYKPVCRTVYAGARLVGFGGRTLGPMHVVSAVAGGTGAAFLFLLCRTLGASRLPALGASLVLATASGYWIVAAGVENAVFGAAAALAALYVAATVPRGSVKSAALAGVAAAASALCHQMNFLLGPAAFLYILMTGTARKKKALVFAAAFAVGAVLLYGLAPAALLGLRTPTAYADWFFYYARGGPWGGFALGNFALAADGLARAFYVNSFADNVAAPFARGDARLLRFALPLWLAAAAAGATLVRWLVRARRRGPLTLLAATFLAYGLFIFWWLPGHADYWLVPAACLAGAVAVAVSGSGKRWGRLLLLALAAAWAAIAAVNWQDGVRPRLHLEANADYRAGVTLSRLVPPDGLCYLASSDALMYARYFGGLKRARTPNWAVNRFGGDSEKAARRTERLIRREFDNGRSVYVGDRAFPGTGGPPLRKLGERLLAQGRPVGSYAGANMSETVYVLTPADAGF